MCFAPQRRALFSTSQLPKVVREWCALYILTWKCASRHNGVHFFDISTCKSGPNPSCFDTFGLEMCFAPQRRALFSTSQLPKVVREWCALYILTWKCASRHNGVHFFDISTCKSGPNPSCFDAFGLEMCFAPQRRALFRHLNLQKWSGAGVLCTFWLGNVLRAKAARSFRHLNFQKWSDVGVFCAFWLRHVVRATTACTFSSLIWPAGSAPAAALARLLFDPPEPQIIGKTQWTATSLPFGAPASSFFWLSPSLIFSLLDFSSLTLPTSAFPSLHIVGSLTSKLPSVIYIYIHKYIHILYTYIAMIIYACQQLRDVGMSHAQAYPWATPWLLQDTSAQWLVLSPVPTRETTRETTISFFGVQLYFLQNMLISYFEISVRCVYIYICYFIHLSVFHPGWWINFVWFIPNFHWSIKKGGILHFEPAISQCMQMVNQTDPSYFFPNNMIDGTNFWFLQRMRPFRTSLGSWDFLSLRSNALQLRFELRLHPLSAKVAAFSAITRGGRCILAKGTMINMKIWKNLTRKMT